MVCIQGRVELARLRNALQRVVQRNPILAGRLRRCSQAPCLLGCGRQDGFRCASTAEVHFDGDVGVPWAARMLQPQQEQEVQAFGPEYLCEHSVVSLAQTVGPLHQICSLSEALDDPSKPLCAVNVVHGEGVFAVVLSVSHAIADCWSVHSILRVWEEEYADPGSSQSLGGRGQVDEALEEFRRGQCAWEARAEDLWRRRKVNADLANAAKASVAALESVSLVLTERALQRMKAEAKAELPPSQALAISSNDAFWAIVGRCAAAEVVAYGVNFRFRVPQFPTNALAHGDGLWWGVCDEPEQMTAWDLRKVLAGFGLNSGITMRKAMFEPVDNILFVNSIVKVQYEPKFGGVPYFSLGLLDFTRVSDRTLRLFFANRNDVLMRVSSGHYYFVCNGATKELADGLEQAFGAYAGDVVVRRRPVAEILARRAPKARPGHLSSPSSKARASSFGSMCEPLGAPPREPFGGGSLESHEHLGEASGGNGTSFRSSQRLLSGSSRSPHSAYLSQLAVSQLGG